MTVSLHNDGVHDTLINITAYLFVTLQKLRVKMRIKMPQDESDKLFQREFMRTTIDVDKLFSGVEGSFVVRVFMEKFASTLDFDLKFPFLPVSRSMILKNNKSECNQFPQKAYKATNFSVTDTFIPFPISSKGVIELEFFAQVGDKKAYIDIGRLDFYGEIRKTL